MQYFPILAPSKTCWFPVGKGPPLNYDAVFIYTRFRVLVHRSHFSPFTKLDVVLKNAYAACHYLFISKLTGYNPIDFKVPSMPLQSLSV